MEEVDDLGEQISNLSQDVVAQRQSLEEFQVVVMNSIEALRAQVEELHEGLEETKSDWELCKKAVANGVLNTNAAPSMRVEVPRQRRYGGKRDAQEIENFLWSMERYFEATNVQGDQEKVNIATRYREHCDRVPWRSHDCLVAGEACGDCVRDVHHQHMGVAEVWVEEAILSGKYGV